MGTTPDQTTYNFISVRKLLRKLFYKTFIFNILLTTRTYFRRFFWPVERFIFSLIRRDKRYCILHFGEKRVTGLFACFIRILSGIAYAERHAMIPVVDMQSFINAYLYDNEVGKVNSWEYYFRQPVEVSLEEALSSGNYVLCDTVLLPKPRQDIRLFYNRSGQLDYWRDICRRYIKIQPEVSSRLEGMKAKFSGKKILGVLVRGTDYVTTKPHDHPIPPTAEQAIAKCQEVMTQEGFDSVYLATEDKNILAKFQEAFGEKLLLPDSAYVDYDYSKGAWLAEYEIDRDNDKYLRGLEYLVSILFLSQCKGFITSMTSGSEGVMLLSKGFEYLYVFDLGYYD